ncbi:putative quinol monooxygenase [Granulicella cerasi]|uniref:Quinol monooxygenase n=1 Tax=Granulicella cerasi TaxID=741063 RepID=A0ABW1ZE99_9BACT|nr:putative quinol monooxygenase [Granulicella cerasi]
MKRVVVGVVGVLALASTGSSAQTKAVPVTVVSHVDIKPDAYLPQAVETAEKLLQAETVATHKDAGLVAYGVYQEVGSSNHFTIVETWNDRTAYERHVGSPHTVSFREKVQPLLGGPFDTRLHTPLQ